MARPSITLDSLNNAPTFALRRTWEDLFGQPAPVRAKTDLLRRCIAYRLQEDATGGLAPRLRRQLGTLAEAIDQGATSLPAPRPVLRPGTRLVRSWNGDTHRVTVGEGRFTYRDRHYRSLSEIARLITGTRWSGPRFFGVLPERRHG